MLQRISFVRRTGIPAVLSLGLLIPILSAVPAAAFEGPLTFNAADFLKPTPLRSANYAIDPTARNDGLMNRYAISTSFGTLNAIGDAVARERAREMDVIAAIRKVKRTDAYLDGFNAAIAGPLEASKALITKPVQTIENLGDTAKEMVDDVMSAISNFGKKESAEDNAMLKDLIGYNKAKRELAFSLGVDPYSSNPYLQQELGDLAWANFAGGATIDLAISAATVGGVGATISAINAGTATGSLLRKKSPTHLTNLSSKYLADMGLAGKVADPFLFHAKYSVPHQTLLVLALGAMQDVPGRAGFIDLATRAQTGDQTRFFQQTAQIMATYHQQVRPVKRIQINGNWAFFEDQGGRIVVPVPADYLAWTPDTLSLTRALPASAERSLWTTGFVSPKARTELAALGINAEEKVFNRRLKDDISIVPPREDREAAGAAASGSAPASAPAPPRSGATQNKTTAQPEPSGLQNLFQSLDRLIPEGESSDSAGTAAQ